MAAVVAATVIMWSDGAVNAWGALVNLAFGVNAQATTAVMGVRQWGDADLHIAMWGAVTLVVLWAARSRQATVVAALMLLLWSACTEFAQPWFTEQRTRQGLDFVGNAVGILLATGVVLTLRKAAPNVKRRPPARSRRAERPQP